MDFYTLLAAGIGVLAGAAGVLALIAPRTKNTVDDKVLAIALKVKELAESLQK
jgi:hypothetical protein